MIQSMRTIAIYLILLFCGCAPAKPQGGEYQQTLAKMIEQSDRIVVTEHSDQFDAFDANAGKSLIQSEIVYGTHELDASQKRLFLSTVRDLDPKLQNAFPLCIIEPHHSIRFYAGGKLTSTMDICFKCGQVEWDATKATPPWSLYSGLETLITAIGFSPKRDWSALAKQHLK